MSEYFPSRGLYAGFDILAIIYTVDGKGTQFHPEGIVRVVVQTQTQQRCFVASGHGEVPPYCPASHIQCLRNSNDI